MIHKYSGKRNKQNLLLPKFIPVYTLNGINLNYLSSLRWKRVLIFRIFDYYPFGMAMPGRKYNAATGYRYGFNGKEKDVDITNGDLDFGARIYDSRIGKFVAIDLKYAKYPSYSPYNFGLDNPIMLIDIDGNDIIGLLGLTYKNNFGGVQILEIISKDKVWQKLTEPFAKGGMFDKNKIDLEFTNFKVSNNKSIQDQGSYKPNSKENENSLVGSTSILVVLKGSNEVKEFSTLTEAEAKNVERWIISVKTDPRLFSEGVLGVISHETTTHAKSLGTFLNNYLNGKEGTLKEAQEKLKEITEKDKNDTKNTDDHKMIANNEGDFHDLNVSVLKTLSLGVSNPGLKGGYGKLGIQTPYDLIALYLNGMMIRYTKDGDQLKKPYKGTVWHNASSNDQNPRSTQGWYTAPQQD